VVGDGVPQRNRAAHVAAPPYYNSTMVFLEPFMDLLQRLDVVLSPAHEFASHDA
jgi:hypothetical protein